MKLKDIGAVMDIGGDGNSTEATIWRAMLRRCYDATSNVSYVGCTVHSDWFQYSIYKQWLHDNNWEKGLHIDKDLSGFNIYSPDTCIIISPLLNTAMKTSNVNTIKSGLPVGVRKYRNKYSARMNYYGKLYTSPVQETIEEASHLYKSTKASYLRELARKEANPFIPKLMDQYINRVFGSNY